MLPLAILGGSNLAWRAGKARHLTPFGWLVIMIVAVPLLASILFSGSLAARYILFVMPAMYVLVADGILWLWRRYRLPAAAGLFLAVAVALLGLNYYFGSYIKSDYRAMAGFLRERRGPDDGVLLYAPRQHLLAKYYLPKEWPPTTWNAGDAKPGYMALSLPPALPPALPAGEYTVSVNVYDPATLALFGDPAVLDAVQLGQ